MPSGMIVQPMGRSGVTCVGGMHKWYTDTVMNIPMMACTRCGYRIARPVLERTAKKRELVDHIHASEAGRQPVLYNPKPLNPQRAIDDRAKRMRVLIERIWENHNARRRDIQEPEDKGW
jgi:hypothetical protein